MDILMEIPEFRDVHAAFHALWRKAGSEEYNKEEWKAAEAALERLGALVLRAG